MSPAPIRERTGTPRDISGTVGALFAGMRCFRQLLLTVSAGVALCARGSGAQSLRGSPSSVELMYARAESRGLDFLRTPDEVYRAASAKRLKTLSITNDLDLEKVAFPFVLPNTLRFADSLARQYH